MSRRIGSRNHCRSPGSEVSTIGGSRTLSEIMRSGFHIRILVLIIFGLWQSASAVTLAMPVIDNSYPARTFACLPNDVQLDEVVTYGRGSVRTVTVERQLVEMKARCRRGKLVDAKRREIRFFRPACWGNPPENYLEIRRRENEELARLKRRYRVIVFGCNPRIA
jgi:hypothetical protein